MRSDRDDSGGPGGFVRDVSPSVGSDLADLLPDADYEFPMRFQRGRISEFFGPTAGAELLLKERRQWIQQVPERCAALLPEGDALLEEMCGVLQKGGVIIQKMGVGKSADSGATLRALGESLEPDFLLLKHSAEGGLRLVAGCVCFPSSWSLSEKMGRPVEWIHAVVPGLNDQLGPRIGTFLRRMAPGVAWLRANWGLSRSAELNQHPDRGLPRLDATVALDEAWLRVERQALVALPESGGVLFGIRIAVYPLAQVIEDPVAVTGLRRALQTMSEEMARYKNLATARISILKMLAK